LAAELPATAAGDALVARMATSLVNSGELPARYDWLMAQAPERLRQPLLQCAFRYLDADYLGDPQPWAARLEQLPEAARPGAAASLVNAWAAQSPEEAAAWLTSLPAGESQNRAAAALATAWAELDVQGAAQWVGSLAPGPERDQGALALALALADRSPQQAWDWALSIADPDQRTRAAAQAAKVMAWRDPATALQWIQTGPLTAQAKAELQAALPRINPKP
jgi:hypothetical protein